MTRAEKEKKERFIIVLPTRNDTFEEKGGCR
jgi:hypothetical protein